MKGSYLKRLAVLGVCAATMLGASAAFAAAPGNLDELLEQTRLARDSEAKSNSAREAKFLASAIVSRR